jgi:transposase-like protein
VLGAERWRRWSYDVKVRLVEETLQPSETVCGVARRHGVAKLAVHLASTRAKGNWAEMLRLLLFPSRRNLSRLRSRAAHPSRRLHRLRSKGLESSRLSSGAAVVSALTLTWTLRRCSRFLSSWDDDDSDPERRQGPDRDGPHRYAPRHAKPALTVQESLKCDPHAGVFYIFRGRSGDLVKILRHDGLGMSLKYLNVSMLTTTGRCLARPVTLHLDEMTRAAKTRNTFAASACRGLI